VLKHNRFNSNTNELLIGYKIIFAGEVLQQR